MKLIKEGLQVRLMDADRCVAEGLRGNYGLVSQVRWGRCGVLSMKDEVRQSNWRESARLKARKV